MAGKGAYYRIYETLYEAQKEAITPKAELSNSGNQKKEAA